MPADDAGYPYALQVAEVLRERGYVTTVDVRGRSVASNLRDGARRGLGAIVVVSSDQCQRAELIWRDLSTREERRMLLGQVPPALSV